MEVTGVGGSIKVERRIPIGEGVMVILMVSSISTKTSPSADVYQGEHAKMTNLKSQPILLDRQSMSSCLHTDLVLVEWPCSQPYRRPGTGPNP